MTLKLAQFCDDPKKISTKSSYPEKIFFFLETPKNIEIQNFEPQKISRPPKNIWNLSKPKNIPILYLDLKKRPYNA